MGLILWSDVLTVTGLNYALYESLYSERSANRYSTTTEEGRMSRSPAFGKESRLSMWNGQSSVSLSS